MALGRFQSRLLGIRSEVRASAAVQSQRAPAGALSQFTWRVPPGQPLQPKDNGENLIRGGYEGNVYAARCINRIANDVAGMPFRAGDPISNNFSLHAPLAQLLGPAPGSPNLRWSAHALWRYSIAQYLILGKFCWLKEYAPGTKTVVGLWPLPAQYVLPMPAESGNDYFAKFAVGVRGTVGYFETAPENLVYCYRPSQSDMRQPESPVALATLDLNIATLIGQFDYAFLKNGGVPAYVVRTASFTSDDDRIGFREQFDAKYQGPENAGRVMFYEQDLFAGDDGGYPPDPFRIEAIGLSQKDSAMPELRASKVADICVAFGVPLSILGDSRVSKFTNMQSDRQNYYLTTILNQARETSDSVNIELAQGLGREVGWFDTTDVPELRKPRRFADTDGLQLVLAKVIHPDEFRADAGLPPMKDVGLKPEDVTSPTTVTETAKLGPDGQIVPDTLTPAVPGGIKPTPAPVAAPKNAPLPAAGRTDMLEAARARRQLRHAGPDGHQHVPSGHATKGVIEKVLTSSVQQLFIDQDKAARERLQGRRFKNQRSVDNLYDAPFWITRTQEVLAAATAHPCDEELARQCIQGVRSELEVQVALGDEGLPLRVSQVLVRAAEKLIQDAMVGMKDSA